MKQLIIIILLNVLWLNGGSVYGQKRWSLEECLDYARENNLSLKRQELISRISKNDYIQSYINLSPNLNAFGRHNLSSGKTVNLEDYTYINTTFFDGYAGLQSTVTVFDGLQNWNNILQNRYAFMASVMDVEKSKNDLSLNIASAFLQVLLDKELLKVAENQLQVTELQLERSQRMFELGNLSRGEWLEIKAQAASEKSRVTASRNRLRLSLLTLAQLMDLDETEEFEVEMPDTIFVDEALTLPPMDSVSGNALTAFPEIKRAEYNLMSSKKMLAAARGNRSPSIQLIGTLYSRYSELAVDPLDPTSTYAIGSQLNDNYYKQISVQINIPIFNRWDTQRQISNARLRLEDARLELEQSRQNLYKEIEQAVADALAALENYRSALEAVESNREAFASTEQRFNLGSASTVDYNVAKNNLVRAEAELLQAKYTWLLYSKIVDFYNGIPLSL
ncbi:MAG TPA: TolC family protein [Bacteroidetes bacterium]|nr:TolC family protein [Bacteroidota bacterium]